MAFAEMSFTPSIYHKVLFGIGSVVALCVFFTQSSFTSDNSFTWGASSHDTDELSAANATLNFGAVIAIAPADSPRLPSLLEAANLTGIDIQVPTQPEWTEQSVDFWRTMESKSHEGFVGASLGTTKGTLGHLNALKWFVDSGMDTALILEDDVDWDIELRTKQLPRLAQSFRTHLQNQTQQSRTMPETTHPWGNTSAWDLIHIGHAGDFGVNVEASAAPKDVSRGPEYLAAMQHTVYRDDTLPQDRDMHPLMQAYLRSLGIPHNHRVIQEPRRNLNSWAYAVTRDAALQMLDAAKSHIESNNPFDVFLMRSCLGTDSFDDFKHEPYLRCWLLNPQLFHHQFYMSDSLIMGGDSDLAAIDAAGYDQAKERGEVPNVRCGARSGAFNWKIGIQLDIFGEEEQERLEVLQREVVEKGKCVKDWMQKFNFTNYVDVEQPISPEELHERD